MKKAFKFLGFIFILVLLLPLNSLALMDGSFEYGDTYWTKGGNVFFSIYPADGMPSDGGAFVQLNNGFPGGSDTLGGPNATEIETALGISGLASLNVVEGSYIYQEISIATGDIISFDFNFFTNESAALANNDFAFISLGSSSGGAFGIFANTASASMNSNVGGYSFMTGLQNIAIASPFSGNYKLGFGIVDADNAIIQSAVYLDNVSVSSVPEPASMILFGTGLIVIAGFGRKRFSKR